LAVGVLSLSGCTSGGAAVPTGAPATATSTPTPSTRAYAGVFTPTGDLTPARVGNTATLLPNGRLLIAGGWDNSRGSNTTLASTELYDPASGISTATADLATARGGSTATLLPDGRVLIVGGGNSTGIVASAELYDPTRGTFTPTGDLAAARYTQTATLLSDGRVLVAGGFDGRRSVGGGYASGLLASAELYDPKAGVFTPTADLAAARHAHTATLLSDGRVLVAGGIGGPTGSALASAEIYQ
jgi:hypothetical protein